MIKHIKFTGKYADLKELGFRYQVLFQHQATYTTYHSNMAKDSEVWITKAGGGWVTIGGYDTDMSTEILKLLVENNFNIPTDHEYNYNLVTKKVEPVWYVFTSDSEWMEYQRTHVSIGIRKGTFETLKNLWLAGSLIIVE